MNMKRFLILFSLIAFVTVSCAGPTVYRREEWVISLDRFEKDRKECIESIDEDPYLEAYDKAFQECLEKKGYEFIQTVEEGEKPLSLSTGSTVLDIALLTVISPLIIALSVAYFAMRLGVR
jgi:hypothetical protein